MKRIAKFEKVSFEQFDKDLKNCFPNKSGEENRGIYDNLELPTRSTMGSAGYDFKSPFNFILKPNQTIKFPTGIRCKIEEGWVLHCYPRSSLGFKYRLQLDNTVGIIDSDFYFSDNEGDIHAKLTNCTNENKKVFISVGDGFMQGVFLEYGITEDDDCVNIRNGGIGSTGN